MTIEALLQQRLESIRTGPDLYRCDMTFDKRIIVRFSIGINRSMVTYSRVSPMPIWSDANHVSPVARSIAKAKRERERELSEWKKERELSPLKAKIYTLHHSAW